MRKSTSGTRSRLLAAGFSAGVTAGALILAPSAAFAADITAVAPSGGPTGVQVTVTGTSGTFTTTTPAFILTNASACPGTYSTTATAPTVAYAGTNGARVSETRATFTVPTTAVAGVYKVCAYGGTAAPNNAVLNTGTPPTYTVVPTSTLSPTSGPSGGGNTLTVTLPTGQSWNTNNGVVFSPGANSCSGTYSSSAVTATITPNSGSTTVGTVPVPVGVSGSLAAATPWSVCIYTSGSALSGSTALTSASSAPYNVSLPAVSLNTAIGGTGANLVVSSTSNFLTGATNPAVLVTADTCPATYPSAPTANTFGNVLKSANNRGAFTLPSAINTVGTTYNACIYTSNTNGARLLANAAYTVALPPTINAVGSGGISPTSGSSLGGDTITVTGANFPLTPGSITATLGGVALQNITPIDANTFTAVTPSRAAQNGVPLTVTTATGTATLSSAFNYVNGIVASPNTAPNTSNIWVNIRGVGFQSLTFDTASGIVGATTGATAARVYLADARGACTGNGTCTGANAYVQGANNTAIAECATPTVISDNELFCNLNLATGAISLNATTASAPSTTRVPNGTYTLTVVSNGAPAAVDPTQSVISSGSTFTVADF